MPCLFSLPTVTRSRDQTFTRKVVFLPFHSSDFHTDEKGCCYCGWKLAVWPMGSGGKERRCQKYWNFQNREIKKKLFYCFPNDEETMKLLRKNCYLCYMQAVSIPKKKARKQRKTRCLFYQLTAPPSITMLLGSAILLLSHRNSLLNMMPTTLYRPWSLAIENSHRELGRTALDPPQLSSSSFANNSRSGTVPWDVGIIVFIQLQSAPRVVQK